MSEVQLQVLISPNIGEHLASPYKGSAEKPCLLSDRAAMDFKDPALQCTRLAESG